MIDPAMRYTVHTERSRYARYIRRFSFEGDFDHIFDLDGRLESRRDRHAVDARRSRFERPVEFHLLSLYERLPRDFQISPGVILPAGGQYQFLRRHYQAADDNQSPCVAQRDVPGRCVLFRSRRQVTRHAERPAASRLADQCRRRCQRDLAARRTVHDAALAERRQHAVQPVHFAGEPPAVRHGHAPARMAIALPLDHQAGQRHLLRLHAQLDRPDDACRHFDRKGSIKIARTIRF